MKMSCIAPTLLLSADVDQRLKHWTDIASGEVSCLGLADRTDDGFVVSEVFLLRQTCGAAETEIDQAAVAALLVDLDTAGIDIARVRFWWHSHATFATFWSGTDAHTIDTLATGEWLVSLVVNKAGSRLARLDVCSPARVTLDDIPVEVIHEDLGLRETCEREFGERVREVITPVLARRTAESAAERRLLLEGRIERDRYPGLDWDDIDDLLGPEMGGDGRVDVGL